MELLKNFNNFLRKDSGNDNESTKLRYVVRIAVLLFVIYTMAMICVDYITFGTNSLPFYIIFLFIFIAVFVASYYMKTFEFLAVFNLSVLCWVFISNMMFGWNPQIQLILVILLVLNFFTGYGKYSFKFGYCVALVLYSIFLYVLSMNSTPFCPISPLEAIVSTVLDSIFCFGAIGYLCYVFGKESQALEGKLVEYNIQLVNQANTDPLTGLSNRRRITERLREIVSDKTTTGLCVCICDIDFFKKINDNYGHDIGDKVLKNISLTMQRLLAEDCLIARWGGEEFLIVFPNMNGDEAYVRLHELRNAVAKLSFEVLDRQFGVSLTYGLSEYDFKSDVQNVIKEADNKLYIGKENGRNQIVF